MITPTSYMLSFKTIYLFIYVFIYLFAEVGSPNRGKVGFNWLSFSDVAAGEVSIRSSGPESEGSPIGQDHNAEAGGPGDKAGRQACAL